MCPALVFAPFVDYYSCIGSSYKNIVIRLYMRVIKFKPFFALPFRE